MNGYGSVGGVISRMSYSFSLAAVNQSLGLVYQTQMYQLQLLPQSHKQWFEEYHVMLVVLKVFPESAQFLLQTLAVVYLAPSITRPVFVSLNTPPAAPHFSYLPKFSDPSALSSLDREQWRRETKTTDLIHEVKQVSNNWNQTDLCYHANV